jgi:hypothetical protein
MKKVLLVLFVSVGLSGCVTEATMKQMSADCAKVGGAMEMGFGIFGPSAECNLPEKK